MAKTNNTTSCFFVPKHIVLDEKETEKLLKTYSVELVNLPKISHSDPALKELNVKSGDIIKIERTSLLDRDSLYYRLVI